MGRRSETLEGGRGWPSEGGERELFGLSRREKREESGFAAADLIGTCLGRERRAVKRGTESACRVEERERDGRTNRLSKEERSRKMAKRGWRLVGLELKLDSRWDKGEIGQISMVEREYKNAYTLTLRLRLLEVKGKEGSKGRGRRGRGQRIPSPVQMD